MSFLFCAGFAMAALFSEFSVSLLVFMAHQHMCGYKH